MPLERPGPSCLPQRLAPGRPAHLGAIEIGQTVPPACLQDFPPNTDLELAIHSTDGRVSRRAAHTDDKGAVEIEIFADPSDVPGEHKIYLLRQNDSQFIGQFTVNPTRSARIAIPYRRATPGMYTSVSVILAGFSANPQWSSASGS